MLDALYGAHSIPSPRPLGVSISAISASVLALAFYYTGKVVGDTEVERRWLELYLTTRELSPLITRGVDPSDEVEVIYVFEGAKISALSIAV